MPVKTITGARLGFVATDGGKDAAGFARPRENDCVIRAIALACKESYASVFEDAICRYPPVAWDSDGIPEKVMADMLWARDWGREYFNPNPDNPLLFNDARFGRDGEALVSIRSAAPMSFHAIAIIDGKIYDDTDLRQHRLKRWHKAAVREVWVPS